jgi:pyruvate dehydrogenase E2 component (dihydrolipoamide acetyltransferase)
MSPVVAATEIRMPRLSDSMTEGTIISWLVKDGETVAADDEIVEIETDKATMAYATQVAGILRPLVAAGASVPVGELIAMLESSDDGTPATGPVVAPADARSRPERSIASPVARRLANEGGIDLATVTGSGPGGRIVRADIEAALAAASAQVPEPTPDDELAPAAVTSRRATPAPGIPASAQIHELTHAQRLTAERMQATTTVPEFTIETEVAMERAIALRRQLTDLGQARPVPTLNDLVVKAAALTLRRHPRANASYVDGDFHLHQQINVGIAVAAPDMLLVPTIFDADTKALHAIAGEAWNLADRARHQSLTPPELEGGTFTVSNLGMFGVTAVAPILFLPQTAILGVGAVRELVRLHEGTPVAAPTMTLTLTCDHRVLYGADAARFLADLRSLLEAPLGLLL